MGTVTFLFTDIEGSTRRWEQDPDAMRVALRAHDETLASAIEQHAGWLFKHTGDGVVAAFGSAAAGISAAKDAQIALDLPVRMGLATGEVEHRDGDYFGPALNRAARVMDAGHGGQILVSQTTAGVAGEADLLDLGEHQLRDLSGPEQLFQVVGDGLHSSFPALRTLDTVPGNLVVQESSFVGRDTELKQVAELVRAHRLVTLTGVGGVGKSRLAVRAGASLMEEFADGVWLVELAPIGDPASVADAVATTLRVTVQPGKSVTASIAESLAGRAILLILDNCEHVLDAAADLIEAVLGGSSTVSVLATSREGTQARGEHLWPVPTLDTRDAAASAAVELFVDRAQAVDPGFALDAPDDVEAVVEICRRLDGIALAIELAAARMVSMTPADVRNRLTDRFELLSGSRRGSERHQTLRHAVQWSYDLLTSDEQVMLNSCGVFAGGFDIDAAVAVCGRYSEYTTLDLLDSLVRKSLVTVSRVDGRVRYGMLETIRQFTEDQLAGLEGGGMALAVRDRHARHFAAEAEAKWGIWEGPGMRHATDWVERELGNLRAGFQWAADRDNLEDAASIASHAAMIAFVIHHLEPVKWAEELIPAAEAAGIAQLARLYTAASGCTYTGRAEDAVRYAQAAAAFDPADAATFDPAWAAYREAAAHRYAGRIDRYLEICRNLVGGAELARVAGLGGTVIGLPLVGRSAEAAELADESLAAAIAHENPYWIAFAYLGGGLAVADADPLKALDLLRVGFAYAVDHRLPLYEAAIARELAGLEAEHGDLEQALRLFSSSLDAFHQAGNTTNLAYTFSSLTVFFARRSSYEAGATIYGVARSHPNAAEIIGLEPAVLALREALGPSAFEAAVERGSSLSLPEAVQLCHRHIDEIERAASTDADR
ncbi:MAG: adenylate/guanylate cyclase domain-containing protein [Actinomycetota bacterium]